MQILVDSRENKALHIVEHFSKLDIPFKLKKLDFADYSFIHDGIDYSSKVCIERKATLSEIANNISWKRKQFEAEFIRAKEAGAKVYIIIEDAKGREKLIKRRDMEAEKKYSKEELQKGTWRSELTANSFIGTLAKWKERYGFEIIFLSKKESGKEILNIFTKYIKEASQND